MPILTGWGFRLMSVLAALALASALGLGWYSTSLRAETKRLRADVEALAGALAVATKLRETDAVVAKKHTKRIAALTTQKEAQDAKLKEALAQNAAWRDAVVPRSVLDALRVPDSPEP